MKYIILLFIMLLLDGCLYINERGVSTYLYDKCHEYYDAQGKYHKDCEETLSEVTMKRAKVVVTEIATKTDSFLKELDKPSTKSIKKTKKKCKKKCKCRCKKKRKCLGQD